MLSPTQLQAFDDLLVDLNRAAAEVILPVFRADLGLENKTAGSGDYDPVTLADKGAEAAIRAMLAERCPDHGVIGEEYGEDRPDAEFVWVLDPIDGTRAFVAGLPVWTTLIGLRHEGKPVLGSIGQSFTGELFIGHAGGSRVMSRGSSRPLRARSGVALRDAIIATTDPDGYYRAEEIPAWRNLRAAARIARHGLRRLRLRHGGRGPDRPGGGDLAEVLGHRRRHSRPGGRGGVQFGLERQPDRKRRRSGGAGGQP